MFVKFDVSIRNARAQATVDTLDAGTDTVTPTAVMHFYTAPQPLQGDAITTQALIGSNALSQPSGIVANGVLTFEPVSDELSAKVDGDVNWCRIVDSDGAYKIDLDCGVSGSNAAIIFNSVTARIGGVLQILSGSFTEGNS